VRFIEEEGNALLNVELPESSVVSLSGSNPLHAKAMLKASQSGVVVFLDTPKETILRRLHQMKVSD
jgi:shikimate kinase